MGSGQEQDTPVRYCGCLTNAGIYPIAVVRAPCVGEEQPYWCAALLGARPVLRTASPAHLAWLWSGKATAYAQLEFGHREHLGERYGVHAGASVEPWCCAARRTPRSNRCPSTSSTTLGISWVSSKPSVTLAPLASGTPTCRDAAPKPARASRHARRSRSAARRRWGRLAVSHTEKDGHRLRRPFARAAVGGCVYWASAWLGSSVGRACD